MSPPRRTPAVTAANAERQIRCSDGAALPRRCALRAIAASALAASGLGTVHARAAAPGEAVRWPEVTLLDGSIWNAERARGKTTVVVFWSTTCPFCLRHNAHIEKLRRAAAGRPLEILTVARDKEPAAVRAYLERHGYGFAVTMAQAPMSAALYERRVIPVTVIVDRQGRLKQAVPGEMFEEDVMQLLQDL
jgi:thiol-disulfide isomerase/thioredoxin